jgi:hypothetical protein
MFRVEELVEIPNFVRKLLAVVLGVILGVLPNFFFIWTMRL